MITKKLHQASYDMPPSEGFLKLIVTMVFVPLPILVFCLGGFWLNYYKFTSVPLFSALAAALSTLISFLGVCGIIAYGHKRRE